MERFLDPSDGDFGDLHYGATTLLAEVKKDSTRHLLEERARQYPKTVSAKTSPDLNIPESGLHLFSHGCIIMRCFIRSIIMIIAWQYFKIMYLPPSEFPR